MKYIEDFYALEEFKLYFFKNFYSKEAFNIKEDLEKFKIGIRVGNKIYILANFSDNVSKNKLSRNAKEFISQHLLKNYGCIDFSEDSFILGYVWSIKNIEEINKERFKCIGEYEYILNNYLNNMDLCDISYYRRLYNRYHKNIYEKVINRIKGSYI